MVLPTRWRTTMSWKDIFKSKSPKAKPDPRVRWFGKLPTYADYYSSPADADWVVEFNDWLMKGCELYLGRIREHGGATRLPSAACVLRLPKSGMTVLAAIQDYGGDMRGRPFPLALYAGVPTASWAGPTSALVLDALHATRQLTDLRNHVTRFCNAPGRLDDVLGDRELELASFTTETEDASWEGAAGSLSLRAWFAGAQPCLKLDNVDDWYRLMSQWGSSIVQLESATFTPTLCLPVVMGIPMDVQIPGWLRWLERRMDLKRRMLSVLLCKDLSDGTGRLIVIAREVSAEDYLLLTALSGTLPYVDDACALMPIEGGEPDMGTRLTDDGDGCAPETWLEFVNASVSA